MDSFSVTLVSNLNGDSFAHNNSSSFANSLPRGIDLSDYEVALQQISFHDDRTEIKVEEEEEEEKPNFFNIQEKQNEIVYVYVALDELGVEKKTDIFINFIDNLKTALEHERFGLNIIPTFKHGTIESFQLQYAPIASGYELFLEDPMPRILGFSQTTFVPGTYKNDLDIDEDYFKTLEDGYIGKLVKFKDEKTLIEIDQIKGIPSLEDLMQEIEVSLLAKGYDATFKVNTSNGAVEFNVKPGKTKVLLSSFLNSYLGLEDNFAFIGKGTIKAPEATIFPNKKEYPLEEPKLSPCSKILVCCDLISSQYFAGREMPLLAVIERPRNLGTNFVSIEKNPLVYKSVAKGTVHQIRVWLQTGELEYLKVSSEPTVVSLIFRKRLL